MKKLFAPLFIVAASLMSLPGFACSSDNPVATDSVATDSIKPTSVKEPVQSIAPLTHEDYVEVAERLGIEVAAIKAVVEIEAGKAHKGFWELGKPIINYDMSVVNKFAPKLGVNLSKYRKSHHEI